MGQLVGAFPQRSEFETARAACDHLGLPYEVVSPEPGYGRVGAPVLVLAEEVQRALYAGAGRDFVASGWVPYRRAAIPVPCEAPGDFGEDVFGRAAIMVLAQCVADITRLRLIAHLSGDLAAVFPYLNAVMREGTYNAAGPTFTFMDGYRMISVYPRRIAVAKADEVVDGWRVLESIRRRANEVWAHRREIEPCYEMREKPPALEIFKRLPRTNCRVCGEQTCLAFAVRVYLGELPMNRCAPVFEGEFRGLRDALQEICAGLGVAPPPGSQTGAQEMDQ
jgi:ArsR family metal-binding transcriptional regulator